MFHLFIMRLMWAFGPAVSAISGIFDRGEDLSDLRQEIRIAILKEQSNA